MTYERNDMCKVQELAARQDAIASVGPADRYLPAAAPMAVLASPRNVRELCNGCGQGYCRSCRVAKPRISTRGGLGSRRIWACVSYFGPWYFVDRIGYGNTPAEAFAEWEAS